MKVYRCTATIEIVGFDPTIIEEDEIANKICDCLDSLDCEGKTRLGNVSFNVNINKTYMEDV